MKQHLMYQWKHFMYLKGQIETNITTLICKDAFNIKFSHCTILHGKRFHTFSLYEGILVDERRFYDTPAQTLPSPS